MSTRLITLLFTLLARLPAALAARIGGLLGWIMYWRRSQARRVSEENLHLCLPELSAGERDRLVREHLQYLGVMAMELPAIWMRPVATLLPRIERVSGEDCLRQAQQQGGVIVLAPHSGNWEMLGLYIAEHYPATMMYQPPNVRALDGLIRAARTRHGAGLVPTDAGGVRAMLKVLKRGELACLLPDQTPPLSNGEFAPFFGLPALTMTLIYSLVQRTGARVVCAWAYRTASGGYAIEFKPAAEDIYSPQRELALSALNREVEYCARRQPAQYQWEYKRFRRQPDGSRRYYQNS